MNLYIYWENAEWICSYTEKRICTYREYVECGISLNKILLFVYWEYYEEWFCSYTENTQNESVRILRIRGTDLYVYWEYAKAWKVKYLDEFETKVENNFGRLSGASIGSIGQIT
jgi:hypothetical protein